MAPKLVWDAASERIYEMGVDHGVLYPVDQNGAYPIGHAWNGLTTITESPSGAEATALYADNMKYLNILSAEELGATIEAYTYPDAFKACNGSLTPAGTEGLSLSQQARTPFGLCYRTVIGNDTQGQAYGYKLHLMYGATVAPSEAAYGTINDSPEAIAFSWEVATVPVPVTGMRPTSLLTIDSTTADPTCLAALEAILYGTAATTDPVVAAVEARLPLPAEIITLMTPA